MCIVPRYILRNKDLGSLVAEELYCRFRARKDRPRYLPTLGYEHFHASPKRQLQFLASGSIAVPFQNVLILESTSESLNKKRKPRHAPATSRKRSNDHPSQPLRPSTSPAHLQIPIITNLSIHLHVMYRPRIQHRFQSGLRIKHTHQSTTGTRDMGIHGRTTGQARKETRARDHQAGFFERDEGQE